jgi:hypothetical protein
VVVGGISVVLGRFLLGIKRFISPDREEERSRA